MANDENRKRRSVKGILPAVMLFTATVVFAVGSIIGGSDAEAADYPVWKPLLRIHDRIVLALGQDTLGDVYITGERMLRRAPQADESAVSMAAQAVNSLAAESAVPVYLLAAPTSAGIYSDTLSRSAPVSSEHTVLHDLSAALSEQVIWIEAESWLSAEKEQYIYYRTDPCWTSYGAYCAYRSAIRKLGFAAVGYDKFAIEHFCDDYLGSLTKLSHYSEIRPDLIDLYLCTEQPQDITVTVRSSSGRTQYDSYYRKDAPDLESDPMRVFFSAAEPFLRIETTHQSSKDLLLLTDRFGAEMIPFLLQHYHIVDAVNLELAGDTDWRSMMNGTYSQILILCGADTVSAENGLAKMLAVPAADSPETQDDTAVSERKSTENG